MRIIIIGAGLIGASIACHLARDDHRVVVLDKGQAGATARSFGWINASFYHNAAHHHLRRAGIEAYGRLLRDLPDLPVSFNGALWWEAQGAGLERMQTDLRALDYPVRRLSHAQACQIEPDIRAFPDDVLQFPTEGAAESATLADALLGKARSRGAQVISGVAVRSITLDGSRVSGVMTDTGPVAADHVIVAAGTGAPDILKTAGVTLPMLPRPGVMVTSRPVFARIRSVLVTPNGEVRQLPDGRLMSPAAANHQGDTAECVTEPLDAIAARTCQRLAGLVGMKTLDWDDVAMANRPVPADGLPAIGAAGPDGLSVAVMHSGITLAAITAEAVAAQVMNKASNTLTALLAPYSIARFQ